MTSVWIRGLTIAAVLAAPLAISASALAREGGGPAASLGRYIIELKDPPLAAYRAETRNPAAKGGASASTEAVASAAGRRKLNLRSKESIDYLRFIEDRHEEFSRNAAALLRRDLKPVLRYRLATNGMAVDLTAQEAAELAESGLVKSVRRDRVLKLETFAGPKWIGAGQVWSGQSGFPAARGENIIVGVLDSGINWESPSFDNPSLDGYSHSNPLGQTVGLCSKPEVLCNSKLIGVYDFVSDVPGTEEVEENTNGKDIEGHGSLVASVAVGNPVNILISGMGNQTLSGVAPRANLISYRVCHTNTCFDSFAIAAIEQAIEDGVDILNYSVGGDPADPWQNGTADRAFLNARNAGIVVVTSAGNEGPDDSTIGSPANAPWTVAVGYATHNVGNGSVLQNMVGGNSQPPADIVGASRTGGTGQKVIVHARDYGNALCGAGVPESQPDCEDNLGLSNPWKGSKPFNGEIVVCDRGTYGRVEKGNNLLEAGAGGYILANTPEFGESLVADDHCLPAVHIGEQDGDTLRDWLAGGAGHSGSISGLTVIEADRFADQLAPESSRGPALPPVENVLKPNLIAPGVQIWAATEQGQAYAFASGSSVSSPHVAGAAALVKSVHTDWSVSQLVTAIETTSNPGLARDFEGSPATPHKLGAGRPQLGEAVNTGLYLNETYSGFISANPSSGGKPGSLNLPGLVDSNCQDQCSFTRRVTDHMGGGNWTATPVDFPGDAKVTITPNNFSLGNGSSRNLDIQVEFGASTPIGDWAYGRIKLAAAGSADQFLTVAVKRSGGTLPEGWTISGDGNGGWVSFDLSGLSPMPDATFTSGGLVRPDQTVEVLAEDPTSDDPYDGGDGVFTTWHSLPQGGLWLYAETISSTAVDLDLFVGRDDNANGMADASEELCASKSESELEQCDLYNLPPGNYWILVQNWLGTEPGGDEAVLRHAAVTPANDGRLAASGPGMTAAKESFPVRLSWDNLDALPGEQYLGAVGVGTHRTSPNNIGVIPVRFNRNGVAAAETFPLINGATHRMALDANGTHDRMFIDIPPGVSRLTVQAEGASADQNNGLMLELKRLEFNAALDVPPFATPAAGAPTVISAKGVGGVGPSITVVGVQAGRWYAVLSNSNPSASSVAIRADAESQGNAIEPQLGLWEPASRPGLGQGYEFSQGGSSRVLVWYTYDEAGQPAWYIASNPVGAGNIWTADLLRFTNDGAQQHFVVVGRVTISILAEKDAMFSYTLFGQSGTERMKPISLQTCPQINGSDQSYTGLWYRGTDGLGGASVLVNATTQALIHYLFDGRGAPRWLYAQDVVNPQPTNTEVPILQFSGWCAVCQATSISSQTVGVVERNFSSETAGNWTLDYLFTTPLAGSVDRTEPIVKLTDVLDCQ